MPSQIVVNHWKERIMNKITRIMAMLMLAVFMAACAPAAKSTAVTPLGTGTAVAPKTPSGMETGTTGHSVSTGNVDALIAMVNGFVTSGEITGQAEKGLLA